MAKEKKARKKGKRIRKGRKHESVKIWQKYEVKEGKVERKNQFCPRCGGGVWLSKQKGRLYCGKCGYTSFGPKNTGDEEKPGEGERKETGQEEAPPAEASKGNSE